MKKRLVDCNNVECDLLFSRLEADQKRQCLALIYAQTEINFNYMNMSQWRDIWRSCIMPRLDMQSFGRLKQCCRYFNDNFKRHPNVEHIRRFLANPESYGSNWPLNLITKALPAYCRRFAALAGATVALNRFLLGQAYYPPLKYVNVSLSFRHAGKIEGKTGYVLVHHLPVGNIFDDDPSYCIKQRKDRNANEKLCVKRHKENYKRLQGFL
jgi:hypothetical protein